MISLLQLITFRWWAEWRESTPKNAKIENIYFEEMLGMDKCKKCNVELRQGEAFQMAYESGKYCESCLKKHEHYMTEAELKKNGLI